MTSTIVASIYIPRMKKVHSELSISETMSYAGIGLVSYVDYTSIDKKQAFSETDDSEFVSAFVHFLATPRCDSHIVYNRQHEYLLAKKNRQNANFWDVVDNEQPFRLQVSSDEYWICLKNKKPVKRTRMNVHQIVENCAYLENLVEEQAVKIACLEQALARTNENFVAQANQMSDTQAIIYQLLGGLFNHQTQKEILGLHVGMLLGSESIQTNHQPLCDGKWGINPTTRQGDECEKRIETLENELKLFRDRVEFDKIVDELYAQDEDPDLDVDFEVERIIDELELND